MKSRRRRLRIEVWYLIILAAVIVAAVLFALLFRGGNVEPSQTPSPSSLPGESPEPSEEPDLGLYFPYKSDGMWGYKSNTGEVAIEAQFSAALSFSEDGYAFAATEKDGKTVYGIIDSSGTWVVEPLYSSASVFSEGLAAVEYNEKWGYINSAGEFIADPVFTEAGDFSGGLARVEKNGKWGYIDSTGQFKITNQYDYATDFSEGLAFVAKTENGSSKYYLITDSEEVVAAVTIEEAGVFGSGLVPVRTGTDTWVYCNRRGNQAFDATFQAAKSYSEEMAAVKQDGKWGFIDTLGAFAIEPQFSDVSSFSDGYAAACDENGKWGYIDTLGAWAVQPQYDTAGDFSNGYALVSKPLEQGLIDKYGNYKALYVLEAEASTPEPEEGSTTASGTGTVKATSLNIREEPSTDADIVASLNNGTKVEITGESGDWYKIRYSTYEGYVKKEFITLNSQD